MVCSDGMPFRFPQLTLSTFELVVGAIIAVQCAGSLTASGQGCAPNRTTGVVDVVGVVLPVAVAPGVLPAVGVALPLLPPPIPLHAARTKASKRSKLVAINRRLLHLEEGAFIETSTNKEMLPEDSLP